MSLGSEMIDLIRFDIVDDVVDLAGVSQISIMQEKPDISQVRIHIEMIDPGGVEGACPSNDPMHFIVLVQ